MPSRLTKYLLQRKEEECFPIVNVLFLNHKKQQCGVYQYGKRVFNILKKCRQVQYVYHEVDSELEYNQILRRYRNKETLIFNYHPSTMPWLNSSSIPQKQQTIGILHECDADFFTKKISIDPDATESFHVYNIPRPLLDNISYRPSKQFEQFVSFGKEQDVPIFGSFGFGFQNKGFPKIVQMVNEQYDKAIIKMVITCAQFGGEQETLCKTCQECFDENKKPDIILMIHTEFISEEDLLVFLRSNTMNLFLYDRLEGRGISSTIDYALSVQRPLGISNSSMFRHIYDDKICLDHYSIEECRLASLPHCQQFLSRFSHENMISKFLFILQN
jgi:hypothetical protein